MDFLESVKQDAAGRWLDILNVIGIDIKKCQNVPCPICPDGGTDRFTFDNKTGNGNYYCRRCGPGSGLDLVSKVKGVDFSTALHMVAGITGTKPTKQGQTMLNPDNGQQKRKMLNDLWKSSTALTGSDPVSKYLHSRKISVTPDNIRYCAECYDGETRASYPAMIAKIHHAGKPVGLHRTFLQGDMESRKKMMPAVDPLKGGAVKLFTPGGMFESGVLGVAEGIETACSAAQLELIATWAALSTSLMVGFEPPEKYRKIVIFADADPGYAGQKAAYALAYRLSSDYVVTVRVPEKGDYNDVLMRG